MAVGRWKHDWSDVKIAGKSQPASLLPKLYACAGAHSGVAAAARAFLRPHASETIRGPENKRLDMTKPNRDAAFGRLAIDRLCKSAASRSRA